jgi:hypothetical protein
MVGVSVASECEHAVQVRDAFALLHRMAEGTLMSRMSEGPPGSCWSTGAESCRTCRSRVAAQPLGLSRTTVEAWWTGGVLVSAHQRLRHEVTMDDDLAELGGRAGHEQLRLARGLWMIRSHLVGHEVQDQANTTRAGSACLLLASALRPPK